MAMGHVSWVLIVLNFQYRVKKDQILEEFVSVGLLSGTESFFIWSTQAEQSSDPLGVYTSWLWDTFPTYRWVLTVLNLQYKKTILVCLHIKSSKNLFPLVCYSNLNCDPVLHIEREGLLQQDSEGSLLIDTCKSRAFVPSFWLSSSELTFFQGFHKSLLNT